jgi:hypothetical protein
VHCPVPFLQMENQALSLLVDAVLAFLFRGKYTI